MKLKFTLLFTILITSIGWSQPKQHDSEELEKRHGFKNIKLNQHIDSVQGAEQKKEFMEKEEFPAKLYTVKNDFLGSIGEIKVRDIQLKTYKDLVYDIEVTTDKDPRLMQAMEKALGKATFNIRTNAYHWRSKSLALKFIGNKNTITLHYVSYTVHQKMRTDAGKKVEEIADDF
jgi:hypothetical protein